MMHAAPDSILSTQFQASQRGTNQGNSTKPKAPKIYDQYSPTSKKAPQTHAQASPYLDAAGLLHWPILFLYPEVFASPYRYHVYVLSA